MSEELFDVVIFERASRKIDAVVGKEMHWWDGRGSDRNTVDLRIQTGTERINDRFHVIAVPSSLKLSKGDVLPKSVYP